MLKTQLQRGGLHTEAIRAKPDYLSPATYSDSAQTTYIGGDEGDRLRDDETKRQKGKTQRKNG